MKREMICIICPRGCSMCAEITDDTVKVTGNTCPKGEEYAVNECLHPVRTVTATVRVENRDNTMASVKTQAPVPKENMMDVIKALRAIRVRAPLAIGEIILDNVFGTSIIVTKAVD